MDNLYLKLVLEGNTSKYSYFIEKYKDMAFSIAFRIINNREDAEEIVQDSFLKAFRSLHKFRQDSKFSTWLYRIVVNSTLSRVRSKKPDTISTDAVVISDDVVESVESVYRSLALSEQKEIIDYALGELKPEDRLILTLYYLNENTINEIMEITGISEENIKMKLYRARNKMYKVLNEHLKSEVRSIL